MNTKFDIGEEVYIPATILQVNIFKNKEEQYIVRFKNRACTTSEHMKEDQLVKIQPDEFPKIDETHIRKYHSPTIEELVINLKEWDGNVGESFDKLTKLYNIDDSRRWQTNRLDLFKFLESCKKEKEKLDGKQYLV